jgi:Tol biopolymer transport system component
MLVLASTFLVPGLASASPAGPRLAFSRLSVHFSDLFGGSADTGADFLESDLLSSGPLGGHRRLVAGDAKRRGPDGADSPAWSPAGELLAFGASDGSGRDIHLARPDGTGTSQVTHLGNANSPVFSADGTTLYFSRFHNGPRPRESIWAIGIGGGGLRQLTPWRAYVWDQPASVSPTTGEVAFTRDWCVFKPREVCGSDARAISPITGGETLLAENAREPAFSPDGQRISLASYRDHNWHKGFGPAAELYLLDPPTGVMQRLTRTRNISEEASSWDPSGERLAAALESGSNLVEMNVDGSCRISLIRTRRKAEGLFESDVEYYDPAWQPGPGREAGRIAC